jgi:hypothetical protein
MELSFNFNIRSVAATGTGADIAFWRGARAFSAVRFCGREPTTVRPEKGNSR